MNYSSWSISLSITKMFQNFINTKTDISNSDIPAHQKVFFSSSLSSPGWIRWDQWFSRHTCIFSCSWCFISESSLRFNSKNILTFCYKCALVQKLSKQFIKYETKNKVDGSQTPFYINVIKRAKQNILTLKVHLSFLQKRAVDLMEGLVILTWVDPVKYLCRCTMRPASSRSCSSKTRC